MSDSLSNARHKGRGAPFWRKTLDWFKEASESGQYTRTGLARQLCELTNWLNQRG
ncbi:MAG: hypothetical protein OXD01_02005 [Gammaproteobacteria bacterium]|nr:hypothetical protein [Gammaproteobacteria bacterium]